MTNTEVKAGQFETDEIHRTITFSLIIIRMEQHWAEGIEMESTQHTAIPNTQQLCSRGRATSQLTQCWI